MPVSVDVKPTWKSEATAWFIRNALSGVDDFEDENPTPHISLSALARVDFWVNCDVFDLE